ncbi:DUF3395 domain-containing protein [Candidatus Dependentiae bacterium]|nr:DUF3395 domain-containing protein [Candidatus Dependentiae bacterium]
MIFKKIFYFFSLLTLLLNITIYEQTLNSQTAKLLRITNDTEYQILFEESVIVPPRKTLSSAPLPATIPKEQPGISIQGTGKRVEPFFTGQVIDLYPLLGMGWGWLDEEYLRAQVTVVFQAKTESDIRIALHNKFSTDPIYVIIIGGDGNTRSSILKNGVVKSSITRDENPDAMVSIIRGQESGAYIPFWICFDKGLILVGKGWPGDNIFLSWKDPKPNLFINKIGLGSGSQQVRYTNVLLLPPVITFPPTASYDSIPVKPIEEKKEEVQLSSDKFIRYGSIVRIKHIQSDQGLKVYVPTPKVIVAGQSDLWTIKGPHGKPDSYRYGEQIRSGSVIRLENLHSKQNLNFKENVEVVGQGGIGNDYDNWIVDIPETKKGSILEVGKNFYLINEQTKKNLVFSGGSLVSALDVKDNSALWKISFNQDPITSIDLPTGSIIALKTNENKYLSVQPKATDVQAPMRYGDNIILKNTKDIIIEGESKIIEQYLAADGAQRVFASPKQQRWKILNFTDPSSLEEIRYGDIVILQTTFEKFLGKIDKDQLIPAFEKPVRAISFVITDPQNPLNRNVVLKGDKVAFESIGRSYISNLIGTTISLKQYIGTNEIWEIIKEGEEIKGEVSRVLVDPKNSSSQNFASRFRVLRSGEEIGLQSMFNNKNLTSSKKYGWELITQKSDLFYKNDKSQKFLIQKIGEDYFLVSLSTNGVIDYEGKTGSLGKPNKYTANTIFKLEIISKPDIEILEATYGTSQKVYNVANIVQSLVDGSKLIIPAGQKSKVDLFGDPTRGEEKVLNITYKKIDQDLTKIAITDNEPLMLGIQDEFAKTGIVNFSSGTNGVYFWLPYSFRVAGRGTVSFLTNAIDDLYIAFSDSAEPVWGTDKEFYEIGIGVKNNSEIVLRKKHKSNQLSYASTPDVISSDGKFQKYWVSVNNGIVLVGKGEIGQGLLLAYKDLDSILNINTIGVSNGEKAVEYKEFNFAPPVDIGNPPDLFEEYQKKYQTFLESSRKLIFLTPFTYWFFHQDSKQIMIKDEVGNQKAIAQTAKKGVKDYPFTITINAAGDPIPQLEWQPEETGLRKGLKFGGAMLSSVSGAAGAIPDPRAQAAAAAGMAVGEVAQITSQMLGGTVEGIRTEAYVRKTPAAYSDPEIAANNQRIQALMANIRKVNPQNSAHFKYMIDLYRELILLIVSPDNVDDVLKDQIFNDLRNLIKYHTTHSPETYNSLINMLLKAHNNRFLFTLRGDETKRNYIFAGINDVAKTLFRSENEFEIEELLGEYLWLKQELPEAGNGSITFKVNGEKDVFVAFSSEVGKVRDTQKTIPMYELIIGTRNNTASIFRLENKGFEIPGAIIAANVKPKAVLELGKYRKFWFSITTSKIDGKKRAVLSFGHDDMRKENTLLEWTDTQPFENIKYVGIGSWESLFSIKDIKIGPPVGQIYEQDMFPIWQGAREGAPPYSKWIEHWKQIQVQTAKTKTDELKSSSMKQENQIATVAKNILEKIWDNIFPKYYQS